MSYDFFFHYPKKKVNESPHAFYDQILNGTNNVAERMG